MVSGGSGVGDDELQDEVDQDQDQDQEDDHDDSNKASESGDDEGDCGGAPGSAGVVRERLSWILVQRFEHSSWTKEAIRKEIISIPK